MGCSLRITRHNTIALRLYWQGRESQESTGLRADAENVARCRAVTKRIDALIRAGRFSEETYRRFFPNGSRLKGLASPNLPDGNLGAVSAQIAEWTVEELCHNWLAMERDVMRPSSLRTRSTVVKRHIVPHLGPLRITELTPKYAVIAPPLPKRARRATEL